MLFPIHPFSRRGWATLSFGLFLCVLLITTSIANAQQIKFRDFTKTYKVPGYVRNGASCYGHGVAMADINNDLLPDI